MKKYYWLGLILALVGGAFLFIMQPQLFLPSNKELPDAIRNLPLTKERSSGNGTVAQLTHACLINGFPCAAGWVHFARSGQLRAFNLAESSAMQGNQVPKGTWVRLDDALRLQYCSFPANTEIQGFLCKGGIGGSEGAGTSFYPSGRLKGFSAPQDIVINGIPCQASLFNPIYLHESGNLKACTLFKEAVVGGKNMPEGQIVRLNEKGEVESVQAPTMWKRAQNWAKKFFS
jgi:hypothetical protein